MEAAHLEPGEADPGNVVPFKQQPRAWQADGSPGGHPDGHFDDAGDLRLPNIITRGQTALAAGVDQNPAPRSQDVTVTATERNFSFSLPMHDPRIEGSLYRVAGALRRAAPADSTAPVTAPSSTTTAIAPRAAGGERSTALNLPGPTMEQETRG